MARFADPEGRYESSPGRSRRRSPGNAHDRERTPEGWRENLLRKPGDETFGQGPGSCSRRVRGDRGGEKRTGPEGFNAEGVEVSEGKGGDVGLLKKRNSALSASSARHLLLGARRSGPDRPNSTLSRHRVQFLGYSCGFVSRGAADVPRLLLRAVRRFGFGLIGHLKLADPPAEVLVIVLCTRQMYNQAMLPGPFVHDPRAQAYLVHAIPVTHPLQRIEVDGSATNGTDISISPVDTRLYKCGWCGALRLPLRVSWQRNPPGPTNRASRWDQPECSSNSGR